MDRFEHIDNYFTGEKAPDQQIEFEERVLTDQEFSEDVAFYLNTIQVAREQNDLDKRKRFREIYYNKGSSLPLSPVRRLWPNIAAAAAVLTALFFGLYLFLQPSDAPKLAGEYIGKHLQTMSVQMSGNADLMQTGKDLYNNGNYAGALQKFEQAIQKDPTNFEAIEFAGIVTLQMGEFDKALRYFTQLSNNNELHVNPGKFYRALTLMKRNLPGDKEQSKILLQHVIREGLFGKEEATEFLKKL